jgi:low affinity Fe/Cu permease
MKFDTSQLLINTTTTIITFLMVALLQNSQSRSEQAVHHKLNAIADSLADHMLNPKGDMKKAQKDVEELRKAVGLEYIESSNEG